MKFLWVLLLLTQAWAVPVVNKNMAAEGTFVTIWPDHKDPDHFYFAPNFMKIALDVKSTPKFHYTEYWKGNCGRFGSAVGGCKKRALVTTLLAAGYEMEQLGIAEAGIRKLRPQARFSAIPFLASEVQFGETLSAFIEEHECAPRAGQAADEIPCTLTFNKRGIDKMVPFLNSGRVIPFKFIYKISGLLEDGEGKFEMTTLNYGLTVNLGGEMLVNHPDLNLN